MSERKRLTDRSVKALKPAPKGKRVEVWDDLVRGFGVRVTDKGVKTFVTYARFRGKPTRRTVGRVDRISLSDARQTAKDWLEKAGSEDPLEIKRAERRAAREADEASFGAAMEVFIRRHVSRTRGAKDAEREIRKELMPRFADKHLGEITRRDVAKMVGEIRDRGAPYQAHAVFSHVRWFYNWILEQPEYEDFVSSSPCDRLKPKRLIGEKKHRTRTLSDEELRAYWHAAGKLGYPYGPLFRLIALTGARKTEAGGARWPEFDMEEGLWTIPPERYKSDKVHVVPLSEDAITLIEGLPAFKQGNFVFTTTGGRMPVNGWSKAKTRLDRLMTRALRALARKRGDDPKKVRLEPFVTHDVRRTMRTRLSQLKIEERVAERVIGHGPQGLAKVYDQWAFLDEKREALTAWALKLRTIVDPPPPATVHDIRRKRA